MIWPSFPAYARATPWWLGFFVWGLACTPPAPRPSPWVHPTAVQWHQAAITFDQLRAQAPAAPYTVLLSTTLRDPRSGLVVDGRGALAVAPMRGLRMILIGVAGATLLDAWVTRRAWRIAVPVASIVRRGGVTAPATMPVAFLRWWFLTRFSGALFASRERSDEQLWLLRDAAAVVELRLGHCDRGVRLAARRRTKTTARGGEPVESESVEECRVGSVPRAGDTVRYADEASGLEVSFTVEGLAPDPPDPAAFVDPDDSSAEALP